MGIEITDFGTTPAGERVSLCTLTNAGGAVVKVTNFGATVTGLYVRDKGGKLGNVVLGFDDLAGYLGKHPYFGATIGRVANRVANARFTLDGAEYKLAANDGPHTLHGGTAGFSRRVWAVDDAGATTTAPSLTLRYTSPDGEEGFPGTLGVVCAYQWTDGNELRITYTATVRGKSTPINLCNHSYFNLRGPGSGDVFGHVVQIAAGRYTPVDKTLIPTGRLAPVASTPFDFNTPTPVGTHLKEVAGPRVGFDHNYVLDDPGLEKVSCRVTEPTTGRVLEVLTTQPGVQFYSGNFLDGTDKGIGGTYEQWGAFCLETQHFPDGVNQPAFPTTILKPEETYRQTTVYRFDVK